MNLMRPIAAIAGNTFREAVRDRVLYVFLVFAFLVTLGGLLLGSLSVGQDLRILEDLALSTISLIGGIIAIFIGTSLVYKEIDRRTIFFIVTKPISRWQFIWGKYLGLALCLLVVTASMGGFLFLLIWGFSPYHVVNPLLWEAIGLIYVELLFLIAIATFFSTFATPIMSVVFTLSLWAVGHMSESLRQVGQLSQNSSVTKIFDTIYWLVPDLAKMTQVRGALMYGHQLEPQLVFYLVTYVMAYMVLLLTLATMVAERREFS